MGSNIDTKQKLVKLTITEYSAKHNISSATCRNWIKSGKVEFEMVKGKYFIFQLGGGADDYIEELITQFHLLVFSPRRGPI